MSFLHAVLLGLIQGVAEFLPISSSGHLAIAEQLLGVEGASEFPGFFDVLLHLGTLAAVFVAYWPEIRDMIVEFFRGIDDLAHGTTPTPVPPARRMILLVILGTLPLFVILPVKDWIEGLSSNLYVVGAALLITGCLLFISDRVRKGRKNERSARLSDALIVGTAQALATCRGCPAPVQPLLPDVFWDLTANLPVRYSFILSIPAVLGANILSLKDALGGEIVWGDVPAYIVGVLVAAVVGYACIRLLKMIADKGKFGAFAYYCWVVGILTIILTAVKH